MKNVRFSIEIESQPSLRVKVETKISETLFPEYNYQLDPNEIVKDSKAHIKNAEMITISIIEYAPNDYNWGINHLVKSVRFIKRNYDGLEWEKRPMVNGMYPDRENVWGVTTKEVHAEIVEFCKSANNLHLDNIRKK
jgi:hypothetical protein